MKANRHTMTDVICEICKNTFSVRTDRVKKGLGRFCSKTCFDVEQVNRRRAFWGRKDLARKYRIGGRYCARWYDESGKPRSTSYGRWWWEMNVGQIPQGMVILHKDNNPMNIDSSNFVLGTYNDMTSKGKKTLKNQPEKWLSAINKRVAKISELRKAGGYKQVNGEKHWKYRGGVGSRYPKDFNKDIKSFIKSRDNYQCQICSTKLHKKKSAHVHHRDGDRNNNNTENLLLLCLGCHSRVHKKNRESPPIMALRSELSWV